MVTKWDRKNSIAPLIVFRMIFGAIMFISILRFLIKGWVHENFIEPNFHFKYYGFEWIEPLGPIGMYLVFAGLLICSFNILVGFYYRTSVVLFFLGFTYVELIDITYYLNHYYFISLIAFLMIFMPADRAFSLYVYQRPKQKINYIPYGYILALQLMISILYIHAGLAKLNYDWMFRAMPLSIWLPSHSHMPLIGSFFALKEAAYVFSWIGCLFDVFIVAFLLNKGTRVWAYIVLTIFHLFTALLFQIGMFPYVMILLTLIFFKDRLHERIIYYISIFLPKKSTNGVKEDALIFKLPSLTKYVFLLFFIFQFIMPWRFILYPGNLFWTEQGYNFSWRVMLMEKSGHATFHVQQEGIKGSIEVENSTFLTPIQEKMMSTQPDLILQFARYLSAYYKDYEVLDSLVIKKPVITADVFVSLNGRKNKRFIDPTVNLAAVENNLLHKKWILPFE
tara:strand:- start:323 stop:1672 length:1350 start_codon:yes stop_codon:yes gene_type:complete